MFRRRRTARPHPPSEGALTRVAVGDGAITGIALDGADMVTADLYLDCSGPSAELLSRLDSPWLGGRALQISADDMAEARLGPPVRTVSFNDQGWAAQTPLRGSTRSLTVSDATASCNTIGKLSASATLGRRRRAWAGNCVGVGHAAGIVEPLTPAPMMLLERDIERLMTLIPVSTASMTVEEREYNRRHGEDHDHAMRFTRALLETSALPDSDFGARRGTRRTRNSSTSSQCSPNAGCSSPTISSPFIPRTG
ncbi:tryptophan 7-halogenase [Sphingomonas aerolata]|uniref:tryptophan 7-halogenase n=1 Tax=Sphingomonas aerolata TaxID=185951 RepID=UPI002FDF0FE8